METPATVSRDAATSVLRDGFRIQTLPDTPAAAGLRAIGRGVLRVGKFIADGAGGADKVARAHLVGDMQDKQDVVAAMGYGERQSIAGLMGAKAADVAIRKTRQLVAGIQATRRERAKQKSAAPSSAASPGPEVIDGEVKD